MDIGHILGELTLNRGYFPREAVEEAIRRRDEITPHLLDAVRNATQHTQGVKEDETPFLPLYAMFLLAQFRDRRAYPLVIELCRRPREILDILLGDMITEALPEILASVFDGDAAPIKTVIEDPSVDEFVRGSALRSLSILVHEGSLVRSDVIAYFGELFHGKLEKEYSHVWDVLGSESADLHAVSLARDIHCAYEDGLLLPGYMQPEEVDAAFAVPEAEALARSKKRSRGLIADVVKEMHRWACFRPRSMSGQRRGDPSDVPDVQHDPASATRTEPKVGRNAPCPCGSGKKYKKCCGARKTES